MDNIAKLIRDPSNRFYAGMTLKEAQQRGSDKSQWRRDFGNLDKNKDGVLSVDEIMQERNHRANRSKQAGIGMTAFTMFDLCYKGHWGVKALNLAFDALLTYSFFNHMQNIKEKSREYEVLIETHNINRYA